MNGGKFFTRNQRVQPPMMGISAAFSGTLCGQSTYKHPKNPGTPPKFNIAPENGWLEDEVPFGMVYFQVLC